MRCLFVFGILMILAADLGCQKRAVPVVPTTPTEVIVAPPILREVRDYEDFTGKTEPVNSIDIRAQVTGYLDQVFFRDGADVAANAPLFEIDPRTYQAQLNQSTASVALAKAHRDRIARDYDRIAKLSNTDAISKEELNKVSGDKAEADAAVAVAEAQKQLAETNLEYTKIRAKFAGRLSRRMVDPGNIVKANETLLTTLVALDPIYATFDVDERTLLKSRRLIREGKADSARESEVPVQIGLADEEGFNRTAVINFIDNRVESSTGTLRVRAIMPNPQLLLSPGLFIRVRIPLSRPHPAILVPEAAIGTNQGLKFVYVVNENDEVVERRVTPGQIIDGYRVIEKGVEKTDRVIVNGLQRVRPGVKVL
ncbi:MAG: efflux RND transporter periplasmic adaptor subunit, partial [Gemmataceae bacterium]